MEDSRVSWWVSLGDDLLARHYTHAARRAYETALGYAPESASVAGKLQTAIDIEAEEARSRSELTPSVSEADPVLPRELKALYRVESMRNLESVLLHGLLSRNAIRRRGIPFADISWASVQSLRRERSAQWGHDVHDYVPLFFCWDTPMNSVVQGAVIIQISPKILLKDGAYVASGNVANRVTSNPAPALSGISQLDWQILSESLDQRTIDFEEWKRRKAAEALIPDIVEPIYFTALLDSSGRTLLSYEQLRGRLDG